MERLLEPTLLEDTEAPWEIRAKSLSYDHEEGVYVAKGDVVISKGEAQRLYCQEAVYNTKTQMARVYGGFRLESGGDVLTGKRGTFDLQNQTGEIVSGQLFLRENHFYLNGSKMEKLSESTYVIKDCEVTTCDGEIPPWSISGSEVRVTIEGYGEIKHAAFRVKEVPLLYFPYFIFPAKTKRQSGILPPRMGYSSRTGVDIEIPYFWAISDQTDATFYQRYLGKRGYMQGLEFRYLLEEGSRGTFLLDVLRDREDKDMNDPDDVELSPYPRTNDTRYWVRGRLDHELPLGIQARMDGDLVSDQDYMREFQKGLFGYQARPDLQDEWERPVEEKLSPLRRSALRLDRSGENYSLQASAEYYQRPEDPDYDYTPQPLGGMYFSVLPGRVLGSLLYASLNADYDYVWRDEGVKGHRGSLTSEISLPLWLGRYLELEPSIQYILNPQSYEDEQGNHDHQTLRTYEATVRSSTSIERIFDVDVGNATRLKHRLRPSIVYTYREKPENYGGSPWFEPVDEEGKANSIAFSLENFLDARLENKKGEVTYRQWATLDLTQGYDVDEARREKDEPPGGDQEPLKPLDVDLVLRPIPELKVTGGAKWDHYQHELTSGDLSMKISLPRAGGREDYFRAYYDYDKDSSESIKLEGEVYLAYGFSVGSLFEKELLEREEVTTRYWVDYQAQCWGVRLLHEREDEERTWGILLQLKGLGEFGTL